MFQPLCFEIGWQPLCFEIGFANARGNKRLYGRGSNDW